MVSSIPFVLCLIVRSIICFQQSHYFVSLSRSMSLACQMANLGVFTHKFQDRYLKPGKTGCSNTDFQSMQATILTYFILLLYWENSNQWKDICFAQLSKLLWLQWLKQRPCERSFWGVRFEFKCSQTLYQHFQFHIVFFHRPVGGV